MTARRPLALLALLATSPAVPVAGSAQEERAPDRVEHEDGKTFEGRVVFEDDARIVLRKGAREIEFDTLDVLEVTTLERSLATALEHLQKVPHDDPRALLDVATLCETRGLPGEAGLIRRLALARDARSEAAHEALGHRRRGADWTAPLDGRWYPWDRLLELRRDWNRAWELETTHYRVRTNLPLEEAIDAVLDLERFYLFFYEAIGAQLDRDFVVEPMEVYLHGDADSYVGLAGRAAWYDRTQRRLVVDGTSSEPRVALFHEATHQLFDISGVGNRSSAKALPAWADEGLAEYLARSAVGNPGRAEFRTGQVAVFHFARHHDAPRPYGLTRFLALESGDFLESSDAALLYSQAYTLVHLCLHGADGRYRDGFYRFLRDCIEGRGAAAAFREHVAKDEERLTELWERHVEHWVGEARDR